MPCYLVVPERACVEHPRPLLTWGIRLNPLEERGASGRWQPPIQNGLPVNIYRTKK